MKFKAKRIPIPDISKKYDECANFDGGILYRYGKMIQARWTDGEVESWGAPGHMGASTLEDAQAGFSRLLNGLK